MASLRAAKGVVVPWRSSLRHSRGRIGAGYSLQPGLLVDAEHNRLVRRIEIQPCDIPHLLEEEGKSLDSLNVSARCGLTPNSADQRCRAL